MSSLLSWLVLIGPLALVAAGALPSAQANAAPRRTADRTFVAALVAFAVALLTAVAVASGGALVSGTLGLRGIGLGVYADALSAVMFVLVSFIGVVVLRYSRNYLAGDPNQGCFLKWMALTLAAVLTLIISGNLVQFIGAWIATSLGLSRLLLFYGERPAAQLAARKKFVASRIGDACLVLAALLLLGTFGTLDFAGLFAGANAMKAAGTTSGAVTAVAFLVVVAALLKSAQLPLHGWLIEVMETPTPVSALLHAGIINAGGFLVLRLADVVSLSGGALEVLVLVGGATALFGSVVMLTQTSVKVSLAYSTVAQMGFMMLQCGLGAFPAALLHIVAHSLYKAHAFLSSGSVIDLARASWTPSPGGQPHPARLVMALLAALVVTLLVAALFGTTLQEKPGAVALGAILLLGLVHLLANAIDERPNAYVIGRTVVLTVSVALAYFALQAVAEHLMASSLPATLPLRGPFDLAIVALVVLSFAGLVVFQSLMARHAQAPAWRALYVHLSHGLYLNTLANRLVLRHWPRTTPVSSNVKA
ncbi:NADH-quinone oxidoreductase subunit L [Salinarimonas soli]|uniref:Probable inorganic carbon transporter subunit DabB n=1 Tax=Salinarimonas soli TaxID=1638099 RepID=A0A5B2VZH6_9HYPH|nr:NADH-quinone oxidoreductase subunit L [Salinarimonas soli]KAA2244068.1 NADH-quinone oxidoreductase subunit L [Salinarimonas soli]